MIILNLFILLLSSALTLSKKTTVYYSRAIILILLFSTNLCYINIHIGNLGNGIGIYGGLFNLSLLTQSFNLFLLIISGLILIYNSFYHRTLIANLKGGFTNIRQNGLSSFYNTLLKKNKISILDNTILGNDQDTFKKGIYKIVEYPLIILFIITGAIFLMSSSDLISVFIAIELQSYGLYILSTLHRDSEQATWGGLTYFLLGGLSSCFILLGSSLLYINSGTTSLEGIYIISTICDIMPNNIITQGLETSIKDSNINTSLVFDYYYLNISLIILSVGFLFKLSAAPFHFWSPDVYDSIPTAVTTYVAIIAKISIFIFLLEIVYFMNLDLFTFSWKNSLLISSLSSLIIGSVLGLTQYRIKKVYAYSTISHVGFILLALCVNSTESIQGYIFYIISYTISNLNAFIILVTIGYTLYLYSDKEVSQGNTQTQKIKLNENNTYLNGQDYNINKNVNLPNSLPRNIIKYTSITEPLAQKKEETLNNTKSNIEQFTLNNITNSLKDIDNSPLQLVKQLKGYFYINSYLALSLAVTLFSFIGIPPLIGFFAKQMVLSAALDSGYIFITLIGILTSVIGATYYLNIIKYMFFFESDYIINPYLKIYNFFGTEKNSAKKTLSNKDLIVFNYKNIKISSGLSSVISILTLILLLFIFIPNESFNIAKILSISLFY